MADESAWAAPAGEASISLQPLDEWARVRLETFRDALINEAGLIGRAKPERRDAISAAADLLSIRVDELIEHGVAIDQPYARAQFMRCVLDAIAGAFRVGAKGERNREIDRALTQTELARKTRSAKKEARRERLAPLVQEKRREHPDADATGITKLLYRSSEFRRSFAESRNTIKADVEAIIKNSNSVQSCRE